MHGGASTGPRTVEDSREAGGPHGSTAVIQQRRDNNKPALDESYKHFARNAAEASRARFSRFGKTTRDHALAARAD